MSFAGLSRGIHVMGELDYSWAMLTIQLKGKKLVMGVKIKATGYSNLNALCTLLFLDKANFSFTVPLCPCNMVAVAYFILPGGYSTPAIDNV